MDVVFKRGPVHNYLGIIIDFSEKGQVQLMMLDYIHELLLECPVDVMKGMSSTPAANHLFTVNPDCKKLDQEALIIFQHLTAKQLYLLRRTQPDVQLSLSFLTKQAVALEAISQMAALSAQHAVFL
jgi:hypothetical protein